MAKKNFRLSFAEACSRYVHRYTMEHVPAWTKKPCTNEQGEVLFYYAPQFRTDREWYDNTVFPGEANYPFGKRDTSCHSRNETWPLGQRLKEPYVRK